METKEKKKPEAKKAEVKKDAWEVKDRYYHFTNDNMSPLNF